MPDSRPAPATTEQPPVIDTRLSYRSLTRKFAGVVLTARTPKTWWLGFLFSFGLLMLFFLAIAYLLMVGVGIWGINIPVAWGFAITNFVWWIGIGHAGTLISAILLLLHQSWRTSINRFAEAMTLFAVACAGLFPLLHLGRPWYFYWLLPYPNTMSLWPQFRSALVADVFAISTYFTISLVFWYTGLVPDFAAVRDRARRRVAQVFYGILALGWRGSARHWHRYETTYVMLAALATPLVVSVHTVVSFDFAITLIPGWHSTVFPPYFVAGAIFSGFAMVLTLIIPVRAFYRLHAVVAIRHLENMGKVMLVTGLIVGHGYLAEAFFAWYSGDKFHAYMQLNRMFGPYAWMYWALLAGNVAVPQLIWWRWARTTPWVLFVIALLVNITMWIERYVIVVTSLHRDFMPSAWGMFRGTIWDWLTLIGSFGLFLSLLFLFLRLAPMASMSELRKLLFESKEKENAG
jgi:molybdopterin-containing oxidoreductase family membrane subunit